MFLKRLGQQQVSLAENGFSSPKWRSFQDALAGILKVTIAVVSAEGEMLSLHNARPPFSEFGLYPDLAAAYHDYFLSMPRRLDTAGADRCFFDPLGLAAEAMPLGDGNFLLLGGCLDQREPQRLQELEEKFRRLGVAESGALWMKMSPLSLDELRSSIAHVEALYSQMTCSLGENTRLGQRMLILSAVEEINKLMVGTLNPEHFDLRRVLDLVASSLVILSEGAGALALAYRQPGQSITACRGERGGIVEALREEWENMAGRQEDPAAGFAQICRDRVAPAGLGMETAVLQREKSSAFLGVLSPLDREFDFALSAFSKQVAIALEVSDLYEVIRQRFGVLFNSLRHGVIITNKGGEALLANRAAQNILTGCGISFMPGEPLDGSCFCPLIGKALTAVLAAGGVYTRQRSVIGEGGGENVLHLQWDILPLDQGDGSTAGAVLVFEDITEQVNLFREIKDFEKLSTAGEVAAGLAHEIRNPLATAKAAIQLFDIITDPGKRRELLQQINAELDRMNDILTEFLSLCKPGHEEPLKPIDPVKELRELMFLIRSEALLHEIELKGPERTRRAGADRAPEPRPGHRGYQARGDERPRGGPVHRRQI